MHSRRSMSLLRVLAPLVFFFPCAHAQGEIPQRERSATAVDHTFSVRQSIEMVRFERTDAAPQFSPDGRYFSVVTS